MLKLHLTVYSTERSDYFRVTSALFRTSTVDAPKQDECNVMHHFKARPLNKKVSFFQYRSLLG